MQYYSKHSQLQLRHYDEELGLNNNLQRSESLVEKFKRLLRVDSDEDTDHLHNKVSFIFLLSLCPDDNFTLAFSLLERDRRI